MIAIRLGGAAGGGLRGPREAMARRLKSNLRWSEDGAAFLGRFCVGRVERVVPEDWDKPTTTDYWEWAKRKTYEALQATPWSAAIIIDSDGGQDELGHFATEEEAQQALAAEVEKAINR
jgi:hypothetical protein